ncbi:hypothetical protein D3C72_716020 [compost metagenome]
MGVRPQPRVIDLNPATRRKPRHTVDFQPADFARMKTLVGAEPVFDAIIDPAVETPEHRVHVRGKRVAEKVVFRRIPARGKICLIARHRHRNVVGRIPRHRRPAHVQPVVQTQFDFRTELAEAEFRQVARVAVLRFPHLEITVIGLGRFNIADPLGVLVVTFSQPRRW